MSISHQKPVYDYIKHQIVDGVLGYGKPIDIRDISETLLVSNIPIREALMVLSSEDLVDFKPGRGFRTKPINIKRCYNQLDFLSVLLNDSASYLTETKIRRDKIAQLQIEHLPVSSGQSIELGLFDITSAFSKVVCSIYRQPQAEVLQRLLFSTAAIFQTECELSARSGQLNRYLNHYCNCIKTNRFVEVVRSIDLFIEHNKKSLFQTLYVLSDGHGEDA